MTAGPDVTRPARSSHGRAPNLGRARPTSEALRTSAAPFARRDGGYPPVTYREEGEMQRDPEQEGQEQGGGQQGGGQQGGGQQGGGQQGGGQQGGGQQGGGQQGGGQQGGGQEDQPKDM